MPPRQDVLISPARCAAFAGAVTPDASGYARCACASAREIAARVADGASPRAAQRQLFVDTPCRRRAQPRQRSAARQRGRQLPVCASLPLPRTSTMPRRYGAESARRNVQRAARRGANRRACRAARDAAARRAAPASIPARCAPAPRLLPPPPRRARPTLLFFLFAFSYSSFLRLFACYFVEIFFFSLPLMLFFILIQPLFSQDYAPIRPSFYFITFSASMPLR